MGGVSQVNLASRVPLVINNSDDKRNKGKNGSNAQAQSSGLLEGAWAGLSNAGSYVWGGVKKAGSWTSYQAKYTAGFWMDKPVSQVTGDDVAVTFAVAAAPYVSLLGIAGCGSPIDKALSGGGKNKDPKPIPVNPVKGFGAQTFDILQGQKHTIDVEFSMTTPALEDYSKFWFKGGSLNEAGADEKLIPDLSSCDPANGHIEGCVPESSCRILYAGGGLDTPPQGSALNIVDGTDLKADLVIDANAPDGGRQLLVKWNSNKYLSGDTFSPLAGDKGMTVSGVPFSYTGTSFDPNNPSAIEWAALIDPAACNFSVPNVLDLFTGVDGAQIFGWEAIVDKGANYGKLLGKNEIPVPLPTVVKSAQACSVKFGCTDINVRDAQGNYMPFGDYDGDHAFTADIPKSVYCPDAQSNCPNYFEGTIKLQLEVDGTGLSGQTLTKALTYINVTAEAR